MQLALELVVGMIDSVMVSAVGEAAVSGVSLVDTVMQLIIYIFSAMAAGGAIVAGQYLGGGSRSRARQACTELVWLNGALALAVMLLLRLASGFIVGRLFGELAADVSGYAHDYLAVIVFSVPAIALFEAGSAVFRTMGNSRVTMGISLFMNGINCVGNAILIYGLQLGTAGAAIATVAGRWFAAVSVIVLLLNQKQELSLERSLRHRFNAGLSAQILKLGVPNGIENGLFQFGKIALLGLVATFGTSAITANAVTQTLAGIEVIPGGAVQLAMVAVIARCVGAGDYEQARYYNKKLLLVSYAAMLVLSLAMVLGLRQIFSLYTLSAETAALARKMFLWHAAGAVLIWPLSFVLPASLRAAGDVRFPMTVSVVSMWVFRIGGAYLLSGTLGLGAVGVWIAMAMIDWGVRALLFSLRWLGGKWQTKRITIS